MAELVTHEVLNQPAPLEGANLFSGNQALQDALRFNRPGFDADRFAQCERRHRVGRVVRRAVEVAHLQEHLVELVAQTAGELEVARRGIYAGAMGYFGADGAMDTEALAAALANGAGTPTIVCAQAGNVNTGACDDLDPLRLEPDVAVVMVRPGEPLPGDADLVLLPGSKSTIGDLEDLRANGWDDDDAGEDAPELPAFVQRVFDAPHDTRLTREQRSRLLAE